MGWWYNSKRTSYNSWLARKRRRHAQYILREATPFVDPTGLLDTIVSSLPVGGDPNDTFEPADDEFAAPPEVAQRPSAIKRKPTAREEKEAAAMASAPVGLPTRSVGITTGTRPRRNKRAKTRRWEQPLTRIRIPCGWENVPATSVTSANHRGRITFEPWVADGKFLEFSPSDMLTGGHQLTSNRTGTTYTTLNCGPTNLGSLPGGARFNFQHHFGHERGFTTGAGFDDLPGHELYENMYELNPIDGVAYQVDLLKLDMDVYAPSTSIANVPQAAVRCRLLVLQLKEETGVSFLNAAANRGLPRSFVLSDFFLIDHVANSNAFYDMHVPLRSSDMKTDEQKSYSFDILQDQVFTIAADMKGRREFEMSLHYKIGMQTWSTTEADSIGSQCTLDTGPGRIIWNLFYEPPLGATASDTRTLDGTTAIAAARDQCSYYPEAPSFNGYWTLAWHDPN